jgi:hypothetical protein
MIPLSCGGPGQGSRRRLCEAPTFLPVGEYQAASNKNQMETKRLTGGRMEKYPRSWVRGSINNFESKRKKVAESNR